MFFSISTSPIALFLAFLTHAHFHTIDVIQKVSERIMGAGKQYKQERNPMTTNEQEYEQIMRNMVIPSSENGYIISAHGTTTLAIIMNALKEHAKKEHENVYVWIIGREIIGCKECVWNQKKDRIIEIAHKTVCDKMGLSGSIFCYDYEDDTINIVYATKQNCNDMDQLFKTLKAISHTVDDDLVFWIYSDDNICSISAKKWDNLTPSEQEQNIKKVCPDGKTELYYYSKNDCSVKMIRTDNF